MKDIECPYCNYPQDVNHDDGQGYDENELHEMECENCGKVFTFTTFISYSYTSYKADCLNEGGVHVFKPTTTFPVEFTMMECTTCDKRRNPTEEEWKEIYKSKEK